jgi:hypothetical protein
MKIQIYLRAIFSGEKDNLMLFDSNRNGAINDLVTIAPAGSKVIWRLDRRSGIKKIIRIYSKVKNGNIFQAEPRKIWIFNIFVLRLPPKATGEERYSIDYVLCNKSKVTIDPTIKIPPPHIDD